MFGVRRIQSHRVLPGEFVYILTQRNFRKVLLTLFFLLGGHYCISPKSRHENGGCSVNGGGSFSNWGSYYVFHLHRCASGRYMTHLSKPCIKSARIFNIQVIISKARVPCRVRLGRYLSLTSCEVHSGS